MLPLAYLHTAAKHVYAYLWSATDCTLSVDAASSLSRHRSTTCLVLSN